MIVHGSWVNTSLDSAAQRDDSTTRTELLILVSVGATSLATRSVYSERLVSLGYVSVFSFLLPSPSAFCLLFLSFSLSSDVAADHTYTIPSALQDLARLATHNAIAHLIEPQDVAGDGGRERPAEFAGRSWCGRRTPR
ncbi:hypothetical protein C8R45DRAFT_435377 [Mycena sanguinolenta]|nr:hypothetical protein C8R45DRAFT_435377 [Mycena sanguinolenta]